MLEHPTGFFTISRCKRGVQVCFIKQSEAAMKQDHINRSIHQKNVIIHQTQLGICAFPQQTRALHWRICSVQKALFVSCEGTWTGITSLINSSLYDQWPLCDYEGVRVLGTCSWDCMLFPGCTAPYKDTNNGFGAWQHLHIWKSSGTSGCKRKGEMQIEISLKPLKHSAKLKQCHNRDRHHLKSKSKGL